MRQVQHTGRAPRHRTQLREHCKGADSPDAPWRPMLIVTEARSRGCWRHTSSDAGIVLEPCPTLTHRTVWRIVFTHAINGEYTRHWASVRCLLSPASVECFSSEKHSWDFSKFSTSAIEKYVFHSLKSVESRLAWGTQPLSTLQTPPPSQSVPTPSCMYQQVQVY